MTTQKIKTMKEALNGEFRGIFQLCKFVSVQPAGALGALGQWPAMMTQ